MKKTIETIVTKVQFNADDDQALYKLISETGKRKRAALVKKMLGEYMQFREILHSGGLKIAIEQSEPDTESEPGDDSANINPFSAAAPIVPFSKLN